MNKLVIKQLQCVIVELTTKEEALSVINLRILFFFVEMPIFVKLSSVSIINAVKSI